MQFILQYAFHSQPFDLNIEILHLYYIEYRIFERSEHMVMTAGSPILYPPIYAFHIHIMCRLNIFYMFIIFSMEMNFIRMIVLKLFCLTEFPPMSGRKFHILMIFLFLVNRKKESE